MNIFRGVLSRTTLAASVCLGWLIFAETCSAQVRRYQPGRPTTSPYLNLTRPNNGGVPNYYSLVRPELQQRNFNRQEQALRQQQARTLGRLENDLRLGRTQSVTTGTGSGFLTLGTKSNYLNTSRYYQQPILNRRGR